MADRKRSRKFSEVLGNREIGSPKAIAIEPSSRGKPKRKRLKDDDGIEEIEILPQEPSPSGAESIESEETEVNEARIKEGTGSSKQGDEKKNKLKAVEVEPEDEEGRNGVLNRRGESKTGGKKKENKELQPAVGEKRINIGGRIQGEKRNAKKKNKEEEVKLLLKKPKIEVSRLNESNEAHVEKKNKEGEAKSPAKKQKIEVSKRSEGKKGDAGKKNKEAEPKKQKINVSKRSKAKKGDGGKNNKEADSKSPARKPKIDVSGQNDCEIADTRKKNKVAETKPNMQESPKERKINGSRPVIFKKVVESESSGDEGGRNDVSNGPIERMKMVRKPKKNGAAPVETADEDEEQRNVKRIEGKKEDKKQKKKEVESKDQRDDIIKQRSEGKKDKKRKKKEVEAEMDVEDPEENERSEGALYKFPMNRIHRIIKSENFNNRIAQEAIFVINKASEKFLELIAKEAYACAFLDHKNHVAYDHLASVVSKRKRLDFLSDFVPQKVKAEDALAEMSRPET